MVRCEVGVRPLGGERGFGVLRRPEGFPERADAVLAQRPWIVPIPGTTKRHRLEENVGAASIMLSSDVLREIERLASQVTVKGDRDPEHMQRMANR